MSKIFKKISFILSFLICINVSSQVKDSKLKELRMQIVLYNLVKNLYLTKEQAEFLLEKAKVAKNLKEDFEEKFKEIFSQQKQILSDLKEILKEESGVIPQKLKKELHKTEYELKKLRKEYIQKLDEIVKEVKSKLSDSQIYIIENFKPCLIPPKSSKLIGQAFSSKRLEKKLEFLRKLPCQEYIFKRDRFIENFLNHILLRFPKIEEKKLEEIRENLVEILDKMRELSDIDFSLQKEQILEEIKNIFSPKFSFKEKNIDDKILHFLLNPQIIPILEEILETTNF